MFSVNIDKLVNMTDIEKDSFKKIVESIKDGIGDGQSVAVVRGGLNSFKLAYSMMLEGNKVLFVDGDITSDIFLGKYKLGKDMRGITDYMKKLGKHKDMICKTNEKDLDIVFTGAYTDKEISIDEQDNMQELLDKFYKNYDVIVVDSDPDGMLACYCDATIIIYDESEFGELAAETLIEKLERVNCNVLGVVISE